ncbi:MAG: hypothetical protein L0Y66_12555 [Myxococcaceae bacterium]|nr:hypothetical protein [Myxococcaceae bacterium]MCI0671109.1 hypothetical protein [Myxococcaceae bacterium]
MAKVKVGDVLEIPTPEGLAYAQYVGKHPEYGDAIWVVPKVFEKRPGDLRAVFEGESGYLTFYPVRAAVTQGLVGGVAPLPVTPGRSIPPTLRRAGARAAGGRVLTWVISTGPEEVVRKELSETEARIPIAAIWNHELLQQRITQGWRPEREA